MISQHTNRVIDETRPDCTRCLKAKLTCGDWPSMTVIQFDGQTKRQQRTLPLKQKSPKAEEKALEVTLFSNPLSPWSKITISSDDIFVNYTLAHLLKGSDQVNQIVVPGIDTTLSDQCFLALSTSYFGSKHGEHALVERGLQRYGSALKKLHEALADATKCITYDVVESVIVMALFEVILFLDMFHFNIDIYADAHVGQFKWMDRSFPRPGKTDGASRPRVFPEAP
jgi:hypothetical protein